MKPVSLADITYDEALKTLEMRKQALDSGQARRLPYSVLADSYFIRDASAAVLREKQAAGFLGSLGRAFNKIAPSRTAKSALIGGGAGLLGGFGKTLMDEDDDNYAGNMLTGGLGGAALGGGIGFALDPKTQESAAKRIAAFGESKSTSPSKPALQQSAPRQNLVEEARNRMNKDDSAAELIKAHNEANPVFENVNKSPLTDMLNRHVNVGNVTAAGVGTAIPGVPAAYMAKNPAMSVDPVLNVMKSPLKALGKSGLGSLSKDVINQAGPLSSKLLNPQQLADLNKQLGLQGKDMLDAPEGTVYRYLNDKKNASQVRRIFKNKNLMPGVFTGLERSGVQGLLEGLGNPKQVLKKTKSFSLSRLLKDIVNERSIVRPAMQAARRAPKGRTALMAGLLAGGGAAAKKIHESYGAPAAEKTRQSQELLGLMETIERLRRSGILSKGN